jgi:hypothetical protein
VLPTFFGVLSSGFADSSGGGGGGGGGGSSSTGAAGVATATGVGVFEVSLLPVTFQTIKPPMRRSIRTAAMMIGPLPPDLGGGTVVSAMLALSEKNAGRGGL